MRFPFEAPWKNGISLAVIGLLLVGAYYLTAGSPSLSVEPQAALPAAVPARVPQPADAVREVASTKPTAPPEPVVPLPPPRVLSDIQKAKITELLKPFANSPHLTIEYSAADAEAEHFSQQVLEAAQAAGVKAQIASTDTAENATSLGTQIQIRDQNHPPPLANALLSALIQTGTEVRGMQKPTWPEKDEEKVVLNVFSNPNLP